MQEERRMTQEELLEEARETAIENAKELHSQKSST
jgi:hypothetical protein